MPPQGRFLLSSTLGHPKDSSYAWNIVPSLACSVTFVFFAPDRDDTCTSLSQGSSVFYDISGWKPGLTQRRAAPGVTMGRKPGRLKVCNRRIDLLAESLNNASNYNLDINPEYTPAHCISPSINALLFWIYKKHLLLLVYGSISGFSPRDPERGSLMRLNQLLLPRALPGAALVRAFSPFPYKIPRTLACFP